MHATEVSVSTVGRPAGVLGNHYNMLLAEVAMEETIDVLDDSEEDVAPLDKLFNVHS